MTGTAISQASQLSVHSAMKTAATITAQSKAIAIDPRFVPAYVQRGNLHGAAGRLDAAIADYRAAVRIDDRAWQAWGNLGVIQARQGRTAEAIRAFEAARRAAPERVQPTFTEYLRRLGR